MENIRFLRSFIFLAKYLNFTMAAEHLYISQPALSKHIAELEEQLGVQLFIRSHHFVQLTPAGFTLYKESVPLLDKINEVFEKTRNSQVECWGKLKIGCVGFEYSFLPKISKHFMALFPHITLDISILPILTINNLLESQEIDIGFEPFLGNELKSKFKTRHIRKSRLGFLLQRKHPYANKYSLDLADLKDERFVIQAQSEFPQGFDWFIQQCNMRGFTPNIVICPSHVTTVFWYVAAGAGIAYFHFDPVYCQILRNDIAFVAMNGIDSYGNVAAYWKRDNPNPAISLFLKEFDRFNF